VYLFGKLAQLVGELKVVCLSKRRIETANMRPHHDADHLLTRESRLDMEAHQGTKGVAIDPLRTS